MNMYTHTIMYILAHIHCRCIQYACTSIPLCMDVGGAYGGWWTSDGVCVTR